MDDLILGSEEFEHVERDAWLDLFAAAPPSTVGALKLSYARLGGMGLLASAEVPIREFNRAMAVGIDADTVPEHLETARDWLRKHAAPNWAMQVGDAGERPAVVDWLREHGMTPSGNGWAKHHHHLTSEAVQVEVGSVDVREVDDASADIFGRVAQAGFGLPASTAEWFGALVGRSGWTTFLAYDGDMPAGTGSMFVQGKAGWMGIGTTLPDHRQRGVQTALLLRRIAKARALGLAGVTTETGYPPPGDAAAFPSYRNCQRVGFRLSYVRPNYVGPAHD